MPILYCSECGASHQYSIEKPVTCAKCHKSMSAGLKVTAKILTQSPIHRELPKVYNSEIEDDYLDEHQKNLLKRQLAASFRSAPIVVLPPHSNTIRLDDLISNPDVINQFEKPTEAPQPRAQDGK